MPLVPITPIIRLVIVVLRSPRARRKTFPRYYLYHFIHFLLSLKISKTKVSLVREVYFHFQERFLNLDLKEKINLEFFLKLESFLYRSVRCDFMLEQKVRT